MAGYGGGVTTATPRRALASLLLVAAAVAAGGAIVGLVRRSRREPPTWVFTDAPLPPVAPLREREGGPRDRGTGPVYGLDVDRIKQESGFEPVVQYLTYIQSQRGEGSHLLFVRHDDLDAMASLEGQRTPAFLRRLDQLGVVVSNN